MTKSSFLRDLDAGERRTIVLYGTSLTEAPWAHMLAAWLHSKYPDRARCLNAAMPGKASRTALLNLEERVLVHLPDCVLLEFAVNDATQVFSPDELDHGISLEESQENLRELITRIHRVRRSCEIFLQTMNPAWDAPNGRRSASLRPQLKSYYQGYRAVARDLDLPLIDHYPVWEELRSRDAERFRAYIPDGIHPEAPGNESITFPGVLAALGESQSTASFGSVSKSCVEK